MNRPNAASSPSPLNGERAGVRGEKADWRPKTDRSRIHALLPLNPWPIAIISFFVLFISFIVAFIVFASGQQMELVRPDYYAEEVRFQQQLDKLNRTQSLKAPAGIAYNSVENSITITLTSAHTDRPVTGRVQFYRPSDARLDQEVELAVDRNGVQRLGATTLRSGLWRVRVCWKADGQEYFCEQPITVASRKGLTTAALNAR